ncbi:dethiobiotin synthase [Marinobacter sp. X15-166B]|uniref:dethiobiotin synthase n=1 Tax=Marinobacter sp. X15-166B TaxID=1897620 RepID=UPI00085C0091|nr:dethiobiotin synthase [Marinobacter sp. X15-166B]OEY65232.1 dethiobiotin synthase [Marinobacter sp. X15-166B]
MARKTFFVTGTDTGVGKTLVTRVLLEAARLQGLKTLAMKPVASGCEQTADGLRNEDAVLLAAAMTERVPYEQVNPVALAPAIAPHVAAQQAGRRLTAERLAGFCRGMQTQPADLLLVEGAGGWCVPLNDRETYAKVPQLLELPVIMVVPLRLGCINHAVLTARAVLADGVPLAGWVGNRPDAQTMSCEAQTVSYLADQLPAPCLGLLPWQPSVDVTALAAQVSLDPLLLG